MSTSYSFLLKSIPKGRFFEELDCILRNQKEIDSEIKYNNLLQKTIFLIRKFLKQKNTPKSDFLFKKEIKPILKEKPLTEKTPWGGVVLKKVDVDKNYIRKLLVIRQYGILGFEVHKFKIEELKILEGKCLMIKSCHRERDWEKGKVEIISSKTNDKFKFFPADEHGLIALSDCVIEEKSTNHLDDLIFIFNSKQLF